MTLTLILGFVILCGLIGLGITYLLFYFANKPRSEAVKKCLENIETVRDLSAHGDRSVLPEIQSRMEFVRRLCKKHDIDAAELDTDPEEIATLMNRVSLTPPPARPDGPIDIGAESDAYEPMAEPEEMRGNLPPVPSNNPKATTPPPIPKKVYELDAGRGDLQFEEKE